MGIIVITSRLVTTAAPFQPTIIVPLTDVQLLPVRQRDGVPIFDYPWGRFMRLTRVSYDCLLSFLSLTIDDNILLK